MPMKAVVMMQTNISDEPKFNFFVPTSTVIACEKLNPYQVLVIEQAQKHRGRFTLVGGKRSGDNSHDQCAVNEFREEVGGRNATIDSLSLWAIKTDARSDTRVVSLKKASDGYCPEELNEVQVKASYGCPDYIYTGTVNGAPHPNDGEAKSVVFLDVRNIRVSDTADESRFGAQHDLILAVYRLYLDGRPVKLTDFTDLVALRLELISLGLGA